MEPTVTTTASVTVTTSIFESETETEYQESEEQFISTSKKYNKTKTATKLSNIFKVVNQKSSNHLSIVISKWIDVQTPSQSGILISTIKEAFKFKEEMKRTLHFEN